MITMSRRVRGVFGSKNEAGKLADIAMKDELAAFDLISSLGSADEGVRETAAGAIVELARRDYDKFSSLVSRWSGERHYKLNAFLKWTDGLQSKNLDRLRKVLLDKVNSGTIVDKLVNDFDSVNDKTGRLRELFGQKKVTQQAYDTLRKEYESQLAEANKKILTEFAEYSKMIEQLSLDRSKFADQLSILETKASLGDISRKESENLKNEANEKVAEIQKADDKLSEELSVMLMSCGPIKIYGENNKLVAVAPEFTIDRENHTVQLKARVLSEGDIETRPTIDNRAELIALIYNLTSKTPGDPIMTADKVTSDVIEKVTDLVAAELKISSEESLHIEKLKFFLELASWRSGKSKTAMIPVRDLVPSESGFVARPGAVKVEETKPLGTEKQEKPRPEKRITPPQPEEPLPMLRPPEKLLKRPESVAPTKPEESGVELKIAQKPGGIVDSELQEEVESLKEMLDEEETSKREGEEKALSPVDDKVLNEIDKAAEKLRQRMKNR
jgi:cell division septum initiation protein DivIVA